MAAMTQHTGARHSNNRPEMVRRVKVFGLLALLVLTGHSAQLHGAYAGRESVPATSEDGRGMERHLVSRLVGNLGDERIVTAGLGIKTREISSFLLRSYDAQTGSLVAEDEFELTVDEDSAAAIEAGAARVYAVGSGLNPNGRLSLLVRAYEAGTGRLLWEDELNPGPGDEREGAALRTNGPGVFPAGKTDSRDWSISQSSFRVQAVNTRTGEIAWQDEFLTSKLADQDLGRRYSPDTLQLFERSFSILIQTYHMETGELLWEDRFYPVEIKGNATTDDTPRDPIIPERETAFISPAPTT